MPSTELTLDENFCRQQLALCQQPQPGQSHLHKKTLARFHSTALEYDSVIQDKTGSGLLLYLRATSLAMV